MLNNIVIYNIKTYIMHVEVHGPRIEPVPQQ